MAMSALVSYSHSGYLVVNLLKRIINTVNQCPMDVASGNATWPTTDSFGIATVTHSQDLAMRTGLEMTPQLDFNLTALGAR